MSLSPPLGAAFHKQAQNTCCYGAAMDTDATFCGSCGKPLIRCMAAEECGGLLDDHGLCMVCVAPHVQVDAGALAMAHVGDSIALPISITNVSAAGRPLFITGLWSREGGIGPWQEETLGWERLGAKDSRPATITARQIERSGSHRIELRIAVSNRWQWREERYVFSADVTLTVARPKDEGNPAITIGGETAGHGNIVYISNSSDQDTETRQTHEPLLLNLIRVEKAERELQLRGFSPTEWVSRNAQIIWNGFPVEDVPPDGPITTPDGLLGGGRSRSRRDGGKSDFRFLVETFDGTLDEQKSLSISRRHLELYIENDCLMLRVTATLGLKVDGQDYKPDMTVTLRDGALISPIISAPDALGIAVQFHTAHGCVQSITLTRTPLTLRSSANA